MYDNLQRASDLFSEPLRTVERPTHAQRLRPKVRNVALGSPGRNWQAFQIRLLRRLERMLAPPSRGDGLATAQEIAALRRHLNEPSGREGLAPRRR